MHGLIRQGAEFGAQCRHHPAGKVQIAFVGGFEVFFNGNQLLLADKTMPATQRLGVNRSIGIVFGHIAAHYTGGVFGNFQAGLKLVLQTHTRYGFGADGAPTFTGLLDFCLGLLDFVLVLRHGKSFAICSNIFLKRHRMRRWCGAINLPVFGRQWKP